MSITGSTSQATGNDQCVSYGLESGDFRLLLTAPYSCAVTSSSKVANANNDDENSKPEVEFDAPSPLPNFNVESAHEFFRKHGLAARAVALEVKDARKAFEASVANGAVPILEPTTVTACPGQTKVLSSLEGCQMAEVELYGDVVLRYISYNVDEVESCGGEEATTSSIRKVGDLRLPFLPHLAPMMDRAGKHESYGIYRIDHAVGNVPNLQEAYSRIQQFTGFHEFAEFTPEDVGTLDSGLNSVVLASDSEEVLLPLNEPTTGRRKSQIQTYLEQNEGAGLQHLALKTNDIFKTIRTMRNVQQNSLLGFDLMKRPSDEYYKELPGRLGDQLTPGQYEELEELGILADADEEGVLLQLFTKPVGDRPTFFFEIIQRIGCPVNPVDETIEQETKSTPMISLERPGCGGFGQGNFRELFKSIEEHEKTLKV
jgi:4-hydroxyphenylpyruvate dioxygenase